MELMSCRMPLIYLYFLKLFIIIFHSHPPVVHSRIYFGIAPTSMFLSEVFSPEPEVLVLFPPHKYQ